MDDLQGKDLKWAYWYNTHQDELHRVGYGMAIAVVSVIWLVNIIMFAKYLIDQPRTNLAINGTGDSTVNYDSIKAPQNLVVEVTDTFTETDSTIDVYAKVTNPNSYHAARFNYTVSVAGTNYEFTDGVVMPNSSHEIVIANLAGSATAQADVVITDITWQRVYGQPISTEFLIADLNLARSNLTADEIVTNANSTKQNSNGNSNTNVNSNVNFATPDEENNTNAVEPTGAATTQLTGKLSNAGAYGFRRVVVTAVLTNTAGVRLGAQQMVFKDMESFKDYRLLFNWQREFDFNAIPTVTVETDIWDDTNLILPGQN
jgi:hypothetical protein